MVQQTQQQSTALTERAIRTPKRRRFGTLAIYLMLIVVASLFAVPFYWLIVTSLKLKAQVFSEPLIWFPEPIMWSNYPKALTSPAFPFFRMLGNTLFYTLASTLGMLLSSTVVAYAFARMSFRGREFLFGLTLATMMLPGIVTLIPTYILFAGLGWVGSYAPLIIPAWFGGAFNIFLLRQFMLTIPIDLTDAARVDGAGDFRILVSVMVPLMRPVLLVVAIFHFLYTWNDFMGPLIYLSDSDQFPLVLGLYSFRGRLGQSVDWHLLMAATMAVIAPLVALFFAAQRYFIEGVTMTGLKGA
jgi:multiple sugar transport system permease protein